MKKASIIAALSLLLIAYSACGAVSSEKSPAVATAAPTDPAGTSALSQKTTPAVSPSAETDLPGGSDSATVTPTAKARSATYAPTAAAVTKAVKATAQPTKKPAATKKASAPTSVIIGQSDNIVTDKEKKALLDSIEKEVNSLASEISNLDIPDNSELYYD